MKLYPTLVSSKAGLYTGLNVYDTIEMLSIDSIGTFWREINGDLFEVTIRPLNKVDLEHLIACYESWIPNEMKRAEIFQNNPSSEYYISAIDKSNMYLDLIKIGKEILDSYFQ